MSTQVLYTGKTIRWTVPLKMSLRNISKRTYLITFSGIGKVVGETIDCSEPLVAMFVLDDNNIESSFKVLDGGSCPNIISNTHKAKWESKNRVGDFLLMNSVKRNHQILKQGDFSWRTFTFRYLMKVQCGTIVWPFWRWVRCRTKFIRYFSINI